MTNSNVVLPPEIESLVQERGKVWAEYDAAAQDAATIKSFSGEVGSGGAAAEIGNLVVDAAPPEEIKAAILAFRNEKTQLENLEAQIRDKAAEIESIRSHVMTMYIVFGVSAVIVIGLLIFWLRSMM